MTWATRLLSVSFLVACSEEWRELTLAVHNMYVINDAERNICFCYHTGYTLQHPPLPAFTPLVVLSLFHFSFSSLYPYRHKSFHSSATRGSDHHLYGGKDEGWNTPAVWCLLSHVVCCFELIEASLESFMPYENTRSKLKWAAQSTVDIHYDQTLLLYLVFFVNGRVPAKRLKTLKWSLYKESNLEPLVCYQAKSLRLHVLSVYFDKILE